MFGKREQIVALSIGVLASIFLVHILVFDPRAKRFNEIYERFNEGTQLLSGARMPAGERVIPNFQQQTAEKSELVTSVVAQLELTTPKYYETLTPENIFKRYTVITGLVRELVELRQSVRQPVLTFLDARPSPLNPNVIEGWNLPRELPRTTNQIAIGDTIRKAVDRFKIAQTVPDPLTQLRARQEYNILMDQIGARPLELANYYAVVDGRAIFFNDANLAKSLMAGGGAMSGGGGQEGFAGSGARPSAAGPVQAIPNPFSINRYGPFVPDLKRLHLIDMISKRLTGSDALDFAQMAELFEMTIILDESLLTVERQLRALIDIIRIAERNRITEISVVNLMKPVDMAASRKRGQQGAAPAAAAAPPPPEPGMGFMGNMMGMGGARFGAGASAVPTVAPENRVAVGSGIEMVFRGSNASTIDFLFEVGTSPRTYAIDDLYITARPNNEIETSTTIELVSKLGSQVAAAPAN